MIDTSFEPLALPSAMMMPDLPGTNLPSNPGTVARGTTPDGAAGLTPASLNVERSESETLDAISTAVAQGQIMPLATVLSRVRDQFNGELVSVDIMAQADGWFYSFRVIDQSGRRVEVQVDAKSATILKVQR